MILFSLSYKNMYVPKINFVLCKKFIRTKFSFAPPAFPTKNKYKCKQIYYIIRTAKLQAFFQKNCNPSKKRKKWNRKSRNTSSRFSNSPLLSAVFLIFKKIMSNDFEAQKRYFRNSIDRMPIFRYNRMGSQENEIVLHPICTTESTLF